MSVYSSVGGELMCSDEPSHENDCSHHSLHLVEAATTGDVTTTRELVSAVLHLDYNNLRLWMNVGWFQIAYAVPEVVVELNGEPSDELTGLVNIDASWSDPEGWLCLIIHFQSNGLLPLHRQTVLPPHHGGCCFLVFPPFVSFPNLALADLSAFDYHSHPL
jgi:hypothetical protein